MQHAVLKLFGEVEARRMPSIWPKGGTATHDRKVTVLEKLAMMPSASGSRDSPSGLNCWARRAPELGHRSATGLEPEANEAPLSDHTNHLSGRGRAARNVTMTVAKFRRLRSHCFGKWWSGVVRFLSRAMNGRADPLRRALSRRALDRSISGADRRPTRRRRAPLRRWTERLGAQPPSA